MKYRNEKERIDEIRRLKQHREDLLFTLQEAERRRDLACVADLKYGVVHMGTVAFFCPEFPWALNISSGVRLSRERSAKAGAGSATLSKAYAAAQASRKSSPVVTNKEVQKAAAALKELHRFFAKRKITSRTATNQKILEWITLARGEYDCLNIILGFYELCDCHSLLSAYVDEAEMIPKNTPVLISRVPGGLIRLSLMNQMSTISHFDSDLLMIYVWH